jgi:small subunit ribosomal protein S7e
LRATPASISAALDYGASSKPFDVIVENTGAASRKMFNKSKLQIKEDRTPTELEEEIAKTLSALEQSSTGDVARNLRLTFIAAASQVEYPISGDEVSKYILIRIPFRSLQFYRKISSVIIDHLEEKFNWPVIVVAVRKIQSKREKTHATQKRPRSRTLKAVQQAFLNDIVVPSTVAGRQTRVSLTEGTTERVFLDPMDKDTVQDKIEAMAHAYQKLTTHKIAIEFKKPTSHQIKKLEQKKAKGQ